MVHFTLVFRYIYIKNVRGIAECVSLASDWISFLKPDVYSAFS